ncbi:hypothetical protein HBI56_152430 [Parastagonospora nodorum]|nr:hypothetical protein HBH53_153690 [Parastagonospora nodorum]KAH3960544.1 hypothetical protein HBH52_236310 [Parastagonospora nodorum]KAH3995287.1 hypothetical protein HBI10_171780 [Parastagonospora nodorum]KAH4016218.1 hypothetical protein HBI13_154980 [Parastagonospora nodorum]KAH4100871.1 hypothetical protein HBH46_145760 [Parastagonospora nodorum]
MPRIAAACRSVVVAVALVIFTLISTARSFQPKLPENSIFGTCATLVPEHYLQIAQPHSHLFDASEELKARDETLEALHNLQGIFFKPWLGTWRGVEQWQTAFLVSCLAGVILSLSEDITETTQLKTINAIERYFTSITSAFLKQNVDDMIINAHDDKLWVAVSWIEVARMIRIYSRRHYSDHSPLRIDTNGDWHGTLWLPLMATRAVIFWQASTSDSDAFACQGGITWDPRRAEYKNSITNQLCMMTAIELHHSLPQNWRNTFLNEIEESSFEPVNEGQHLRAAVAAHEWIAGADLTNENDVFVDGWHFVADGNSGQAVLGTRDESVFTYNQGVILGALRGLWDATAKPCFLEDGHKLIQSVIKSTGYDLANDKPFKNRVVHESMRIPLWQGLGRAGVLEDYCDISGNCTNDVKLYKAIFMHYFIRFCLPLDQKDFPSTLVFDTEMVTAATAAHHKSCSSYLGWIAHNARAALGTRDSNGRFGMWWTDGLYTAALRSFQVIPNHVDIPSGSSQVDPNFFDKFMITLGNPNEQRSGRTAATQASGTMVVKAWWSLLRALRPKTETVAVAHAQDGFCREYR